MNNPYYDEAKDTIAAWKNGQLTSEVLNNWSDAFRLRNKLVPKYSFAIPNEEAINEIAKLGVPIIEIGAGTGYWAYLLNSVGVDIICFDNYRSLYNFGDSKPKQWDKVWFKVDIGEQDKIKEYPERTLFLCWPSYGTSMASDCLEAYTGDLVIYVGESSYGCTGNGKFFNILDKEFELTKEVKIPQWYGIHDYLFIYKRKKSE